MSYETGCKWKLRFRSKRDAKRHLKHMQTAIGGRLWSTYRCEHCGTWHVGHKTFRQRQAG